MSLKSWTDAEAAEVASYWRAPGRQKLHGALSVPLQPGEVLPERKINECEKNPCILITHTS